MASSNITTAFSGNPLDRADLLRGNNTILTEWADRDDARFVLFAGDKVLTDDFGDILWLTASKCRFLPLGTRIFLGLDGDAPRYAASLEGTDDEFGGMFAPAKFREGRAVALKLGHAHPTLGIVAQAKSMLSWHKSHRFCAKCGEETELVKAGYERKCPACEASHFPRTDPVVIMLAFPEGSNDEKALLGRGHHLPTGFYSALAGFMEPGETIEEAVARELEEEAGLRTTRVEYKASQPWPWPSTLMIGCFAWVDGEEITIDETEIDDARWVTKDEARRALKDEMPDFFLPPFVAIARDLIDDWLKDA
ncbi:NAD(+) diphosphatase [Kordiimonas aestuarii]|uniref:NAD(+) diphosphatase n=1 Tax=Kordiimonas aestuarii TaxID=1005925 RepID=UPI0021CE1252|nr:NAD(+) diphosphatase [Kordiimonas aestuarii]